MPGPTLADEVTFITGVDAGGNVTTPSFWSWDNNPWDTENGVVLPFNYPTPHAEKWGQTTAGTSGGTVRYYFNPASNWTASEQGWLTASLSLWSALANISFVATTDATQAQITFTRGTDGKANTSSSEGSTGTIAFNQITSSTISIDTTNDNFTLTSLQSYWGFAIGTVIHETGHALGLGHGGPYNGNTGPSRQYSGYDSDITSIMSYFRWWWEGGSAGVHAADIPVSVNWIFDATNMAYYPTTPMQVDILAIQRLYGLPTTTPLSGGQVFGFNCNIAGPIKPFFDFTQNTHPVIAIWDKGSNNTLDVSGFSAPAAINLSPGTYSSCAGGTNNIFIDSSTKIDTLVCGSGSDTVTGNDDGNTISGGAGNDRISGGAGNDVLNGGGDEDTLSGRTGNDALDGGSSVDTAVVSGNRAAYTITQTSTGHFTVTGPDGTDTLSNVEYLKFDDQTMRLLPGTGATVNFAADPSTYMAGIRDFDGNDLGGAASWKLIGSADVNGDGRAEHILFNRTIGRWAEVGTEADGLTYFSNYNWAGDTRVVGIYIDPLVANGTVVRGSDTDSQRRFQNDLTIDNIHGILGQADYDHNGLQEVYFSLTDGTAYLHAYMHADGNIQYANYQSKQQVIDYLTSNGVSSSTWSTWFPASQTAMEVVLADALTSTAAGSSAWMMAAGTGG